MRNVAAATVFLLPLAIAPGLLFFHDVTPKAVIVFAAAALCLVFWTLRPGALEHIFRTSAGRWYVGFCALAVLGGGLSATLSQQPELAWGGSNWRRYGAIAQAAVVVLAVGMAAWGAASAGNRRTILRAVCLSGSLVALYGVLQYLGWDPWLPAVSYQAGEGPFVIVRPPGTLGHSDYLGAFLVWPIFAGVGLLSGESERQWKYLGGTAVAFGIAALILSGSRGALAGLICGLICWVLLVRPAPIRLLTVAGAMLLAFTVFYISPAGERLRARAHWIGEDALGGGRILLWRDSAKMAASNLLLGSGPDSFVAEYPSFQSVKLSRAYPDFYHESPHNLFLDALTNEGLVGLIALLGLCALAIRRGLNARAAPLVSGFIAALVAHQFAVLTLPAAVFLYLFAGLLTTLGTPDHATSSGPAPLLARSAAALVALFFVAQGLALAISDYRLARVKSSLAAKDIDQSGRQYREASWSALVRLPFAAVQADLYFSRRFAEIAPSLPDSRGRLFAAQLSVEAALRATRATEQSGNAWYNLAQLKAASNDFRGTESCLRQAIGAAPNWFKPHWMLARLLAQAGRDSEAQAEAQRALELDGGKHAEVGDTLAKIIRSASRGD